MEIKATGKLELEAMKALVRMNAFKGYNPKRHMIMWCIVFAILAAGTITGIALWGFEKSDIISLTVIAFGFLFEFFLYFWYPKIRYKGLKNLKDAENEYTFGDDSFSVSTAVEGYSGKSDVAYSRIAKVTETNKYLFIYNDRKQAYVVNKSTVEGGNLQSKLKSVLGNKYRFCKV